MMQIDRSNYEVWFIDWLDGNLNSLQVEQLMLFLDQNPDLREELNELTSLNLVSSAGSFRHKENLKKSPPDISEDQFDYLCIAYLENDLSESQKAELEEMINIYPDRKRNFDLIQKTIIAPARISFRHKNRKLRRTTVKNFIRISAIGLSTAAAISIILIIYSVIPGTSSQKQYGTAHTILPDSTVQRSPEIMAVVSKAHILPPAPQGGYRKLPIISKSPLGDLGVNLSVKDSKTTSSVDSSLRIIDKQEEAVIKVPVNSEVDLERGIVSNTLIAAKPTIIIPAAEDERSEVGKFISRTFREKFLKDETPHDTPLKGFEIAEAGVAGLNKLFGWQMALDMKNDDNGQPKSVYFNSKILKVNAPVKKREAQP
jgi:hypothetical protein